MTVSEMETSAGGGGHEEEEDEKPRTLFVGNIPREVNKRDIEDIFGDVGPLKRCYIQYPRGGNEKRKQKDDTTVAYVTYALSQDAVKAMETLHNTKIGSNRVNIKITKNARSEQVRQPREGGGGERRFPERSANYEPIKGDGMAKEPRPKPVKKRSRLIVRNLSFKVTEEKMKEYFGKMGEVKEVVILKKPNGKLVGCGFVQYSNVFEAAKAVKELNLQEFLGRPIAIDWALPKDKYQTEDEKQRKKEVVKEEAEEESTIVIKDEPVEEMEGDFDAGDHYAHLKEEVVEVKQEEEEKGFKRKFKKEEEEDESSEDGEDEEEEKPRKRMKQMSNDVEEGKTLFLRNLSFDTSEEDLKEFFGKFGDLVYALLCKDKLTEHPKGTGFVKFKNKAAADDCLTQFNVDPTTFKLGRREFTVSVALPREKVERKQEEKQEKPKTDSRNLYLVREGFIRPGSGAAADVSASDMHKRAALNRTQKQMLKNLNIFISPTRLCIHNLPPTFTDTQLRKLFKKYAGAGAKITEARVMRDMKDLDLNSKGKSKGYGFVSFAEHEHALTALRAVNNNPEIFTPNARPIVEFSLENRAAIKAKERRALKSKEKNPNVKKQEETREESDEDEEEEEEEDASKVKPDKKKNQKKEAGDEGQSEDEKVAAVPKYAGLVAKQGVKSVPSFKPKGKITRNSLKQKKTKKGKKIQERRMREPKIHSKKPLETIDKTERIIQKRQKKLNATSKSEEKMKKKKKWYA